MPDAWKLLASPHPCAHRMQLLHGCHLVGHGALSLWAKLGRSFCAASHTCGPVGRLIQLPAWVPDGLGSIPL